MTRAAAVVLAVLIAAPVATAISARSAVGGDEGPTDPTARLSMVAPATAGGTTFNAISDDGAHVFYSATGDPGGSGGSASRVYDAIAGRSLVQPIDPSGINYVASSSDGRFLIFSTWGQLLPEDTDSLPDDYWYDGTTLKLIRINGMAPQPPKGAGSTPVPAVIAADGSRVVFNSAYPQVDEDLDNENDLYGWIPETGAWSYLTPGATAVQNLAGWTPDLERILLAVSTGAAGQLWEVTDAGFNQVATGGLTEYSPDGARLYFFSPDAYDAADLDNDWDAYELGPDGYRLLSDPSVGQTFAVEVSDDGQQWLLESIDGLVAGDTDGMEDVYLMRTGEEPVLVTGGTDIPSYMLASDDASTLFYQTWSNIDPADTDPAQDLYRWKDGVGTTLVTPGAGTASVLRVEPSGTRALLGDLNGDSALYRFSGTSTKALLTPGTTAAKFVGATTDLKRVFFRSGAKLLPVDTNIYWDVYVSDLDVTPPTVTVQGPTTGTSTSASFTVDSANHEAVWFDCKVDAGAWAKCHGTTQLNGLSLGSHNVSVKGWDAAANTPASPATVTWDVIEPEAVPPTATAPLRSLPSGSVITSGLVPVKLAWSGSDVGSGIARYELQKSVDGGAWTNVQTTLSAPTKTVNLAPSHTYRFRARSVDKATNVSAWATGATFTLGAYQQTNARVTWAGAWTTVSDAVAYWGGSARAASSHGATATFTATARSIAFVSRKGTRRGKAEIYVDGVKVATIDLYASASQNQRVVWVGSWSTSASRTVKVRVLATSGRPRVDVDAFVILN